MRARGRRTARFRAELARQLLSSPPRAGAQGAWRSFLAVPRPPCPRVAPEGLGRSGPTAGPKELGAVLCGTGIDHLPSGWAIMDIREGTGARAWGGTSGPRLSGGLSGGCGWGGWAGLDIGQARLPAIMWV